MSESTGVIAIPRKPTVDELSKRIRRIAVLERRIARRANENAKDKAEIHDHKSGIGVA